MTSMMDRRAFMSTLGAGLLAAPLGVEAQQAGKVWRIGFLATGDVPNVPLLEAFEQALRELGYVEGRNVTIKYEFGHYRTDEFLADARRLVQQKVDLILAAGFGVEAAREATTTTPVVALAMFDALESGLVVSLARPGGNITGISLPYSELAAKRLEILKSTFPHLARVALLTTGSRSLEGNALRAMSSAARSLGLELKQYEMRRPRDLDRAFADMNAARVEALAVGDAPELVGDSRRIATLAIIHHLPTIGGQYLAEWGGLMSYAASLLDLMRRAATYVDKIFKGAQPADLPVEQVMKFELVINLRTAKTLGLRIPQALLQRADRVIE